MKQRMIQSDQVNRIKRYALVAAFLWTCFVMMSATWEIYSSHKSSLNVAYIEARASFNKDLVYRRWASVHGGVYVPVTDITVPNPYLDVPEREITTPSGRLLTLVNPAYMTRQAHEMAQDQYGVRGHITSLNPIRPENAPDAWEADALRSFEQGVTETSSVETLNGEPHMRYMHVMVTEESCLKCHAQQGYQVGDVRGGISVSVPMQPYWDAERPIKIGVILGHSALWLLGMGGIVLVRKRFVAGLQAQETANTALRIHAEQYHMLTTTTMDGFWLIDRDGRLLDVNATTCRMTGYTREELLAMSISDLEVQEIPEETEWHIENVMKNGTDRFLSRHRCKDGRILDVEISTTFDAEQGHLFSFVRDITEQKQAETALRESESLLNETQAIAHVGSWRLDLVTGRLTWSAEVYRMFGLRPYEFEATYEAFLERVHPEDRAAVDAAYTESLKDRRDTYEIEHRILRRDTGQIRVVQEKCKHTRDASGNVIRSIGMVHDITERKQAEQIMEARLQLSEFAITHSVHELLQQTIDVAESLTGSQIGFLHFLDADQKTLTLQAWSTNTLNNMCSAEGEGKHYPVDEAGVWVDCVHQRRPVIHNDYASLSHRKGTPNGHATVSRELVVPIFRNDLIVAILGVGNKSVDYVAADIDFVQQLANLAWDIIAHKKVESELNESTEVIAIKDRFISTVSHEFRTPLAVIQTSSDLLTRYADRIGEERKQELLGQIKQQVTTLTDLIDDVLSISRSRAGKFDFNPAPLNFEAFCRNVFDQLQLADASTHVFEFVSSVPNEPMMLDANLLRHILTNLLSNAIKYSPAQSRITLELAWDASNIIIRVRDEGIGIPEEDMTTLFEPFNRATNVGKTKGNGLGLSIVKEYVILHGGRIEVESTVGIGSTFTVLLPQE